MSSYICLDSSVMLKLLVNEVDSDKAAGLMDSIVSNHQTVVLPDFAWAEVGTVLRKKAARKMITQEQAEIISRQSGEVCEFWTADERMVNSIREKKFIRLLHRGGAG